MEIGDKKLDQTNAELIATAILKKARKGDVKAAAFVRDTAEGRPAQKVQLEGALQTKERARQVRFLMSVTHSLWRRELVTPKTDDSARTIHLTEVLTNLLAERKDSVRFNVPEDFVFGRVDGTPQDPDFLRKQVLYKAMKAAGIEPGYRTHGFHLFRHSAGSIVHSITRDVKTTQELLGHSRLSTTADIYTHVEKVVGEQASEALAKTITDQEIPLASERIQ